MFVADILERLYTDDVAHSIEASSGAGISKLYSNDPEPPSWSNLLNISWRKCICPLGSAFFLESYCVFVTSNQRTSGIIVVCLPSCLSDHEKARPARSSPVSVFFSDTVTVSAILLTSVGAYWSHRPIAVGRQQWAGQLCSIFVHGHFHSLSLGATTFLSSLPWCKAMSQSRPLFTYSAWRCRCVCVCLGVCFPACRLVQ